MHALIAGALAGMCLVAAPSAPAAPAQDPVEYRILATNKTSTMQKEMQEAGDAGYEYRGQTVFKTMFGGKEVVVILERDGDAPPATRYEYRLLATKKTSTLQKELSEAGEQGFGFVGLTVAETAVAGTEVVAILRRPSTSQSSSSTPNAFASALAR